jgi:hypothetical protein
VSVVTLDRRMRSVIPWHGAKRARRYLVVVLMIVMRVLGRAAIHMVMSFSHMPHCKYCATDLLRHRH